MGASNYNNREIESIIESLYKLYPKNEYHITNNNCNHFTTELCKKLVNKSIPGYINRISRICWCFTCCLPNWMMGSTYDEKAERRKRGLVNTERKCPEYCKCRDVEGHCYCKCCISSCYCTDCVVGSTYRLLPKVRF